MKITTNTVPSVSYTLKVDGQVLDQASKEQPLLFIHGVGMMIPGFEKELEGKQAGDTFDMVISPEEGYGERDPQAVVDLPLDVFKDEQGVVNTEMLVEGNVLPMQHQDGTQLQGRILEVGDQAVKMDFNHMLAGQELHFTGEVIEVREATAEELDHGHVHGPGGHQH